MKHLILYPFALSWTITLITADDYGGGGGKVVTAPGGGGKGKWKIKAKGKGMQNIVMSGGGGGYHKDSGHKDQKIVFVPMPMPMPSYGGYGGHGYGGYSHDNEIYSPYMRRIADVNGNKYNEEDFQSCMKQGNCANSYMAMSQFYNNIWKTYSDFYGFNRRYGDCGNKEKTENDETKYEADGRTQASNNQFITNDQRRFNFNQQRWNGFDNFIGSNNINEIYGKNFERRNNDNKRYYH